MIRLAKPPLPHIGRAPARPARAPMARRALPQLWQDYFPAGWREKIGLLVHHAHVMETVTDMPVLITTACLPDYVVDADGGRAALNGGGDIRFTSDLEGRNLLACHVVSFVTANDPANASAEIWVRIPTLSPTADTMIFMWWKKAGVSQPAVGAAGGQYAVYSGLGLTHVYKMEDDEDATINNNDFVHAGLAFSAARIGNGADWTAWVSLESPGWANRTAWTVLAWVKPAGQDMILFLNGVACGARLLKDPGGPYLKIRVRSQRVADADGIWDSEYFLDSNWRHIAISYDNTSVNNDPIVVCDGRRVPMTEVQTPVGATFAHALWYPGPWSAQATFLDELWADDVARSAAWMATVYHLQNDPAKSVYPCERHQGAGRGLYRIFNAPDGSIHNDTIAAFDENLLLRSEEFDTLWTVAGSLVVTPDTDVAPNGKQTADTLTDNNPAAYGMLSQTAAIPADLNWVYCFVHVKKDSDTSRFPEFVLDLLGAGQKIGVQLNTSTGATTVRYSTGVVSVNVTDVGDDWRLELGVKNDGGAWATFVIRPAMTTTWGDIEVTATGSIVVWGAQMTLLSLKTYKPTRSATDTSVTLTIGGLTDGDRDGEVFVSGGNFYAVIRNGVDSVLVVGDASGEAGACTIVGHRTYRLYRKLNTAPVPGIDPPFAEGHSLPATPDVAWADGDWYISATRFNGVIESGRYPVGPKGEPYQILTISGAAAGYVPPQGPYSWALEPRPAGVVRIHGTYVGSGDAGASAGGRAEEWVINYTTDGSVPVAGTPDFTSAMSFAGQVAHLSYDLPAQDHGRNVRVLLRTRRNDGTEGSPVWTYSANVDTLLAVADAIGPTSPLAADMWRGRLPEDL